MVTLITVRLVAIASTMVTTVDKASETIESSAVSKKKIKKK